MGHNLYEPPKSQLVNQSLELNSDEAEFYIVAIPKFLILFVVTFGIYNVYWFYKNWTQYKLKRNASMWPVMRGLFSIFFAHSLFRRVNETIQKKSLDFSWSPGGLATLYVVCSVVGNVSDRLAMRGLGPPLTDIAGFIMLAGAGLALYKAQIAINLACNDPDGASNSAITAANIVWIILGSLLWVLIIIGLMFPESQI